MKGNERNFKARLKGNSRRAKRTGGNSSNCTINVRLLGATNRARQTIKQNSAATNTPTEPRIVGRAGPPVTVKTRPIKVIGVEMTNIQNWYGAILEEFSIGHCL